MDNEINRSIEAVSAKIGHISKINHIQSVVLSALAGVPVIGGSLSTLISNYAYEYKARRILGFIEDLGQGVEDIKNEIDNEYIKKEEFSFIFEQTLKGVIENYQKEKIDCFKYILLNSMKNPRDINQEEREIFLKLVNDLTSRHIRILKFLNMPLNYLTPHFSKIDNEKRAKLGVTQVFKIALPEYSDTEILVVLQDLRNLRLILDFSDMVMTLDAGLARVSGLISPLGKKLISFITHV
jgi:hypothetical protein